MLRKNKQILENYLNNLQNVDSLEKLDRLINKVTHTTNSVCQDFRCQSGCFTCCKGSNIPLVYAREWQRIREHIKIMPKDIKNQVKENFEQLFKKHDELLHSMNNAYQENCNKKELVEIKEHLKDEYSEELCALHINGKCSVYEVRPEICRGFGYFSNKNDNKKVEFLTCETLKYDLQKRSNSLKAKPLVLPFWNPFKNKLHDIAIDGSEKYEKAIIPFWLKNDFESGNIE